MKSQKLTTWIVAGMVLGVVVGYYCHARWPDPAEAKEVAGYFSIITDVFLRLIKMIIAPLVFAGLVSGIASMDDHRQVGRIGLRALGWFVCASLVSLLLGMVLANMLQLGQSLNLTLPEAGAATNIDVSGFSLKNFLVHLVPTSFFDAMSKNEILQILLFSLFFGFAISSMKLGKQSIIVRGVDELFKLMLRVTDYVMWAAPFGVFAAIASVVTTQGLGVIVTYSKLIGAFYAGLMLLWALLISVGILFVGRSILRLMGMIREPMIIAFSTASSEAAYPKTLEQLERFGVSKKISGFVLPLGYSFNLDGSMMYQSFAVLFIAQAYGIHLTFAHQVMMLLMMMLMSKGMAGVPRASLVVVAAALPMLGLPMEGLLLVMGVDQFFDMGRTATNVVGNSIASVVVAKWEGALSDGLEPEVVEEGEPVLVEAKAGEAA